MNALASSPDAPTASVQMGDHPAVVVARTRAKGIDPNKFVVAHPARLQLLAASPTATKVEATATAAAGR